jgi:hypothetical protein
MGLEFVVEGEQHPTFVENRIEEFIENEISVATIACLAPRYVHLC